LTNLKKRAKILAQHFGRVIGASSPIIAGYSAAVKRKIFRKAKKEAGQASLFLLG
jgi:hypothetical protein